MYHFTLPKERVRSDLKRIKNRLQVLLKWQGVPQYEHTAAAAAAVRLPTV